METKVQSAIFIKLFDQVLVVELNHYTDDDDLKVSIMRPSELLERDHDIDLIRSAMGMPYSVTWVDYLMDDQHKLTVIGRALSRDRTPLPIRRFLKEGGAEA